jgi:excisionase family DNA binding protein
MTRTLYVAPEERLLTPSEVAALFRVDPKTVTRWAVAGKIKFVRTLGGHRRYREQEVLAMLGRLPDTPATRAVDDFLDDPGR